MQDPTDPGPWSARSGRPTRVGGRAAGGAPRSHDGLHDASSPPQSATRGLAVYGQHFYVWDEDSREATCWGGELASLDPVRRGGEG